MGQALYQVDVLLASSGAIVSFSLSTYARLVGEKGRRGGFIFQDAG